MVRAPSWPWVRGVSGVSTSSWASQLTNRSFIPPALRHHSFLWMKASGSGSSPSLLGLFSSDHIGSLVHTQPPASKGWTFIPCNQTEAKRLASSACPLCFLCFWPTETFFFSSYFYVWREIECSKCELIALFYPEKTDLLQRTTRKIFLISIYLKELRFDLWV